MVCICIGIWYRCIHIVYIYSYIYRCIHGMYMYDTMHMQILNRYTPMPIPYIYICNS